MGEQDVEIPVHLYFKDQKCTIFCKNHETFLQTFASNGIRILSPLVIVQNCQDRSIKTVTLDTPVNTILNQHTQLCFHQPIKWNTVFFTPNQLEFIKFSLKIITEKRAPTLKDIIDICSHHAQKSLSRTVGKDIFTLFNSLGLGLQLLDNTFFVFKSLFPNKPQTFVIDSLDLKVSLSLITPTPQLIILRLNKNQENAENVIQLKKDCLKQNILILSTKLCHQKLESLLNTLTKEQLFYLMIKHQPTIIWDIIRKLFLYNKHIINQQ